MASGTPRPQQPTQLPDRMRDLVALIDKRRDEAISDAGLGPDFLAAYQAIEMRMGKDFREGVSMLSGTPADRFAFMPREAVEFSRATVAEAFASFGKKPREVIDMLRKIHERIMADMGNPPVQVVTPVGACNFTELMRHAEDLMSAEVSTPSG
jgi:hypothetical protein